MNKTLQQTKQIGVALSFYMGRLTIVAILTTLAACGGPEAYCQVGDTDWIGEGPECAVIKERTACWESVVIREGLASKKQAHEIPRNFWIIEVQERPVFPGTDIPASWTWGTDMKLVAKAWAAAYFHELGHQIKFQAGHTDGDANHTDKAFWHTVEGTAARECGSI